MQSTSSRGAGVKEFFKTNFSSFQSALNHLMLVVFRDVKPSNFLYDRANRRYSLVDFGLAQYQKDLSSGGATQASAANRGTKRKAEEDIESEATVIAPCKKGEKWQLFQILIRCALTVYHVVELISHSFPCQRRIQGWKVLRRCRVSSFAGLTEHLL